MQHVGLHSSGVHGKASCGDGSATKASHLHTVDGACRVVACSGPGMHGREVHFQSILPYAAPKGSAGLSALPRRYLPVGTSVTLHLQVGYLAAQSLRFGTKLVHLLLLNACRNVKYMQEPFTSQIQYTSDSLCTREFAWRMLRLGL